MRCAGFTSVLVVFSVVALASRVSRPRAHGDAARMLEDAHAYQSRVVADAEGESARFEALLTEYQKAPRVTRDRLYIDAVEEVYRNSTKVILDSQGSGNLLYLPIDKLIEGSASRYPDQRNDRSRATDAQSAGSQAGARDDVDDSRERRTRQ